MQLDKRHACKLMVIWRSAGIVGAISPATWGALETVMTSGDTADYQTMARALATLGATRDSVDVQV